MQACPDVGYAVAQVFIDLEGSVVISFDRSAAAHEGDLSSYMNRQAAHGGLIQEYRCVRQSICKITCL